MEKGVSPRATWRESVTIRRNNENEGSMDRKKARVSEQQGEEQRGKRGGQVGWGQST